MCPYAKRGVTIGTQYNTTSILRTIEQILGIPPMNHFDASATPMSDCFTDVADLAPYSALPVGVRLDEMNPGSAGVADPVMREDALASASIDFSQVDKAPEGLLNPNAWIFWSVIGGPLVLEAWARSAGAAVSFFAGFYLTLTGGMAGLIVLMAVAHRLDPRLVKGLNLVSAHGAANEHQRHREHHHRGT